MTNRLVTVGDGIAAIDYLSTQAEGTGRDARDRPAVVLFELNLSGPGGLGRSQMTGSDRHTYLLRATILTASRADEGLLGCCWWHRNQSVRKPFNFNRLTEALEQLHCHRLALIELPSFPRPIP